MGIDNILIADDDFAFVNRLKNGLQQFGQFTILTAPDGQHALRLLTTRKISLVVTDMAMPKMDGLELLAAMSRQFPNVLSIVITSMKDGILKKKATGDSVFCFLNKPVDHVRLHTEIIRALDCRDELYFKAGIYPATLLPLVHIGKKSCQLDMRTGGGRIGTLIFADGMLEHASCDDQLGLPALEDMLTWEPCKYWFREMPLKHPGLQDRDVLTAKILAGTGLHPAVPKPQKKKADKPQPPQPETVHPPKKTNSVRPQPNPKKKAPLSGFSERCSVLIVDASVMMRTALKNILATDPGIVIAGEAVNGQEALRLIKQTRPDVVILDFLLPGMDGMTVLKHMMIQAPTPTIIFSAVTREGAAVTFDTLKYGAIDFMAKPLNMVSPDMNSQLEGIREKVHHAAKVKIESARYIRSVSDAKKAAAKELPFCERVVCIGAAEGGYAALLKIIPKLSPDLPASFFVVLKVIPQHVDAFINYLARHSIIRIARAVNGSPVEGSTCYFSSGLEYVTLAADRSKRLTMQVKPVPSHTDGNPINTLMFSAAKEFSDKSTGVVLSGSGVDGTEGLKEISRVGGRAIIQNPDYCLQKEMVENARRHIGDNTVLADSKIAEILNKICVQGF